MFIGESGRTALRLEAEYELLFTQRLILTPEIEVNLYGQNDPDTGVGSGLSDLEVGLRLRYEIRREFAPYIGVNWLQLFGNTADFVRAAGESTSEAQFTIGSCFYAGRTICRCIYIESIEPQFIFNHFAQTIIFFYYQNGYILRFQHLFNHNRKYFCSLFPGIVNC